ncbi:MAG: pyridoxal-dependent decarboxylase [Rhodothermales bacterium]
MHKAAFLGPKAENADELERLLLEVLHDHVFWRRNFHPEDDRLIREGEKRTEDYGDLIARFRDELFQILAELKRGAPLYSPRQVAHMVSDPTMASLIGYFAGMLYNQNNVVAEVAPETVRKEQAYLAALARMIGYPLMVPTGEVEQGEAAVHSWGHLTSGGTVANIEALWVARNLRFFPPAVRLLASRSREFDMLNRIDTTLGRLEELSTFDLFNLTTGEVLALRAHIHGLVDMERFESALPDVRRLGIAGFLQEFNAAYPGDPLSCPRVYISRAAHYCWEKAMDLTGLGRAALIYVPVEEHMRIDAGRLEEHLLEDIQRRRPVLAVVSICGTTEEGAVDPVHAVAGLQASLADYGFSFWHHCDAAMGGFFASMLPPRRNGDDEEGLSDDVEAAIMALGRTDSITIDPHKFGYVPYPSGAVLYRDYKVRDFISFSAPYLGSSEAAGFGGFLGGWTLEGSRPGASAVSCYLSQAVLPLEPDGHGRLMQNCVAATREIVTALKSRFRKSDAVALHALAEPDTVGFCFLISSPGAAETIRELNELNVSIWRRFASFDRSNSSDHSFLFSKTEIDLEAYEHVVRPIIEAAGVEIGDERRLTLLRMFVMHPFASVWREGGGRLGERIADQLLEAATEIAHAVTEAGLRSRSSAGLRRL